MFAAGLVNGMAKTGALKVFLALFCFYILVLHAVDAATQSPKTGAPSPSNKNTASPSPSKIQDETPDETLSDHPSRRILMVVVACLAALAVVTIFAFITSAFTRKIRNREIESSPPRLSNCRSFLKSTRVPLEYLYAEICLATKDFNRSELLGSSESSRVFKGHLVGDTSPVAIKMISGFPKLVEEQIFSEISVLGRIEHKRLVLLRGWCHNDDILFLVYDYMPLSLEELIFSPPNGSILPWELRLMIIQDVAEALTFLHEGDLQVVLHRNLKASNVFFGSDMRARIGDFGITKLIEQLTGTQKLNRLMTQANVAPELICRGRSTEKSDVYSFGVLILEVISGKRCTFQLLDQAWEVQDKGLKLGFLDPKLEECCNEEEMSICLKLALICCHPSPDWRPSMRRCSRILKGQDTIAVVPTSRPEIYYPIPLDSPSAP